MGLEWAGAPRDHGVINLLLTKFVQNHTTTDLARFILSFQDLGPIF